MSSTAGVPAIMHVATPVLSVVEAALDAGYAGVMIDLQHGEIGLEQACTMLRAIPRGNSYAFARAAGLEPGAIGRLLDSGARGIIAPTIETAQQAEQLVAATKYPPLGRRSLGPSRPALYDGPDYCAAGNAMVATIVQIETAAGVEAAADILAVDGVDAVYVGPADLAVSYGLTGRADWADGPVADGILRVAAAAREAGVRVGLYCSDPAFAAAEIRRAELDFVGIGIDLMFVGRQARATVAALAAALEEKS